MNLKTALMIMMPPEVQTLALPTMRRYAERSMNYYPAHMTVIFPYVPFEALGSAILRLHAACVEIAPFRMTLFGYGMFKNAVYMAPTDPELILEVFHKVFDAFPEAPPYGGAYGNDPHPHVTVGLFDTEEEKQAAELPEYFPVTFLVDRFHVLYGSHDMGFTAPWITEAVVPLGEY